MIRWFRRAWYGIHIKLLLLLKPAVLFKSVNQLDWYMGTLHKWINDQEFNSNLSILEVGCATGALSEYLAECGHSVTGVDSSSAMINAASSDNCRARYQIADVTNLPFEDNVFDAVISASVINIVPDQHKALIEMARVCKPGGSISVLFPAQGFNNKKFQDLLDTLGISGFSEAALKAWHHSAPKLDKKNIETLLKETGLIPTQKNDYLDGMVFSITATRFGLL